MAKKSKGFAELLQQQQDAQLEKIGMTKLEQKVRGIAGGKDIKLVQNLEGVEKMSEVLETFVEPYLDFADSRADREKLFTIAVAAWNLTFMPEEKRSAIIKEMIAVGVDKKDMLAQQDMRAILNEMIARKLTLFSDNQRLIINFQLQELKDTFHLSVASTLTEPPDSRQ
jgi:hypothetical protein